MRFNQILLLCAFVAANEQTFSQQPRLVLPIGHTGSLTSANYSPDGKYIVTTGSDKTGKVWTAAGGKLLFVLKGHTDNVCSGMFSPDGKYIVTASEDSTAKIWNAVDGSLINTLRGHTATVKSASFSPDGRFILTASWDLTARIWNASDGKFLKELKGHTSLVHDAMYSPDGKFIITGCYDGMAITWDANEGKPIHQLIGHTGPIESVCYSPNGKFIATASDDSTVVIWDATEGARLKEIRTPTGKLNSARFSPDSRNLVISCRDGSAKIWDCENQVLIREIKDSSNGIQSAAYSPDGKFILTASWVDIARTWNAGDGNAIILLKGKTAPVSAAMYSSDGKRILTVSGNEAMLWDARTGKLLPQPKIFSEDVMNAAYSPDGKYILLTYYDYKPTIAWNTRDQNVRSYSQSGSPDFAGFSPDGKFLITSSDKEGVTEIRNVTDGRIYKELNEYNQHTVSYASFSPDGKYIVTASNDNENYTARVWNLNAGKSVLILKGHTDFVVFAAYSPDGKYIVTTSWDHTARIWLAENGKLLKVLKGHNNWVTAASFSPDGKQIITVSEDNTAKIWETETGNLVTTLHEHTDIVSSAMFSPDGNHIITASFDNTSRLWDSKTKHLEYTFFAMGSHDYLGLVASGYYQCSPEAAKFLHFVTKDLKVITFEQLDVKYNRPDKVLEAIGNNDTALIKSYRKAWEKRIKKLGIDTTAFRDGYSVPEADFVNRDNIEYEQKSGILSLHIKGSDSSYKLDRFNVWVNEAPLYGQRGLSIKKKNKNELDTVINIQLSEGENRIESSITNVNGTESYRMPLIVNYTPAVKQKETTRFIGIGIDQFADNQYNLRFSSKDIRDLSLKLKEKYGDAITIDTLFNKDVTINNIKALKQKLIQTSVNDKVIIAYSGHGLLSRDFDYFLSTYSVNFNKPEENGLPYDELENLLDSIPARKKLMLIDACHSGEVDKEELVRINSGADSLHLTKGIKPVAYEGDQTHLGMKNSFELMQNLFVNVGKSTGATIISAAAGTQFALERGDLQNGVFTYCILEAMENNKTMKISELKKIVGERVEQLTNGLQKPTSRNETIAVDWELW